MVMVRVPGSDRFVFLPDHTGDVILDLSDYSELDDTLQNEDVVVIGDWEDYTGTGEANKGGISKNRRAEKIVGFIKDAKNPS